MNLPNLLSLSRIIAVPGFVVLLLAPAKLGWGPAELALSHGAALLLTIIIAITDWLDGELARRTGQITALGKLLDPLADKVFVSAALVAFTALGLVPAWVTILVITREFLVTGLRSVAVDQGRVIAADRLGKHKTGWQLALIISTLVATTLRAALIHYELWDNGRMAWIFHTLVIGPMVGTILLTVASGWNYLWSNRDLLKA